MGQQVINPQTGERLELVGNQWVPVNKREQAPSSVDAKTPEYNLTGGPVQAALISAGDVFNTIGINARDVYAKLRGDEKGQAAIQAEREQAAIWREKLHEEAPKSAFVGAMLPTLPLMGLSGGAPAAGMLGNIGKLGQMAAGNAVLSAAQSQSGDYAADAAMGGAFSLGGAGASNIVKRVMAGRAAAAEGRAGMQAISKLTGGEADIIAGADRAGMTVLPGQRAGDRNLRMFEENMAANPMMGGVFHAVEEGNQAQLNRLAAKAMGIEADNVGAVVSAKAEHAIGEKFHQVGKSLGYADADPLIKKVTELAENEKVRLSPRGEIFGILDDLQKGQKARLEAGGQGTSLIEGTELMEQRSVIAKKMRDAYQQGKSIKGELFGEVLDIYDQSIEGAVMKAAKGDLGKAEKILDSYGQAREQWSVLRAMDRGGASIDGNVLPGQAARLIKTSDKSGFAGRANDIGETVQIRGTGALGQEPLGDFYDALRFKAAQIGRPVTPPTGMRLALSQWMGSGSTLGMMGRGGIAAAKALTATPLAQAYMNQSPAATATMFAVMGALKGQPVGGAVTALGQQGARAAPFFGGQ